MELAFEILSAVIAAVTVVATAIWAFSARITRIETATRTALAEAQAAGKEAEEARKIAASAVQRDYYAHNMTRLEAKIDMLDLHSRQRDNYSQLARSIVSEFRQNGFLPPHPPNPNEPPR